jgi:hypothetical protein
MRGWRIERTRLALWLIYIRVRDISFDYSLFDQYSIVMESRRLNLESIDTIKPRGTWVPNGK